MGDRRQGTDQMTPRLVAVAVLGFLLFAPPMLLLFNHRALLFGVPVLVVYLFVAWALVIGLVAAVCAGSGRTPE
jgi:hypothetical protein